MALATLTINGNAKLFLNSARLLSKYIESSFWSLADSYRLTTSISPLTTSILLLKKLSLYKS